MPLARPRMRTLLVCLLLLAGGAIINIAVAWGFAAFGPFGTWTFEGNLTQREIADWRRFLGNENFPRQDFPEERYIINCVTNLGFRITMVHETTGSRFEGRGRIVSSGWPFLCLRSGTVDDMRAGIAVNPPIISRSQREMSFLLGQRYLPTEAMYLSFAANNILFAIVLWTLVVSPFALRRLLRRRGGLCPKCAYPIGSSDTCTECGRPVRRKAETQKVETV